MSAAQATEYARWASKSALKLGALLLAQRHALPDLRCPEVIVPCQRRECPEVVVPVGVEIKIVLVFVAGVVLGLSLGGSAVAWWLQRGRLPAGRDVVHVVRGGNRKALTARKDSDSSSGTERARARARALSR